MYEDGEEDKEGWEADEEDYTSVYVGDDTVEEAALNLQP
jgi:hypothetical protein